MTAFTVMTVSEPSQVAMSKLNTYTVYKVSSSREDESGKMVSHQVSRRYKDFVWLHTQLEKEHPQCLVPPLPAKKLVRNLAEGHISDRMKGLQSFMTRIVNHDLLQLSSSLDRFLSASEMEMTNLRNVKEETTSAAAVGFFSKQFKGISKTIANKRGQTNYQSDLHATVGNKLKDTKEENKEMEQVLKHFNAFQEAERAEKESMTKLAVALQSMSDGAINTTDAAFASFLRSMAKGLEQASALQEAELDAYADVEAPLVDLSLLMGASKDMLNRVGDKYSVAGIGTDYKDACATTALQEMESLAFEKRDVMQTALYQYVQAKIAASKAEQEMWTDVQDTLER